MTGSTTADTLMDLVDALSSNTTAASAVELTLNSHFRRHYSALNKTVQVNSISDEQQSRLAAKMMGRPARDSFIYPAMVLRDMSRITRSGTD